jgi:hypothetical protein
MTRTYFFEPFSPPPLSPQSPKSIQPYLETPYSPIYFRANDCTKYDVRSTYPNTHPIRAPHKPARQEFTLPAPPTPRLWTQPVHLNTVDRGFVSDTESLASPDYSQNFPYFTPW